MSDHSVCILLKNDKTIVLLGEKHFKTKETEEMCSILVNKFNCVGYENSKLPTSIFFKFVSFLTMNRYEGHSAIFSKNILCEYTRKNIPNTPQDCYIMYNSMSHQVNIKKENFDEAKIDIFDLEKDHVTCMRERLSQKSDDIYLVFLVCMFLFNML